MRATWAILAALALAGCGRPATGPDLTTTAAAAHKAADQFVALAKGSETTGRVPRAADPAAAPLLDAVFDVKDIPASASFADLDPVSDWLLSANRIGQVYILAGTGQTDASKAGADLQAQANRNVATFAPEIGRYMDTEMALLRVEAGAVSDELARRPDLLKDPVRADGLAKVREGLTAAVSGEITSLPLDGLTDAWREARMAPLLALAPAAARLLTADQLAGLRAQALEVSNASADAALKADLAKLNAGLAAK